MSFLDLVYIDRVFILQICYFRLKESWKRHKEKDTRTAETFKTRIDEKELELARYVLLYTAHV